MSRMAAAAPDLIKGPWARRAGIFLLFSLPAVLFTFRFSILERDSALIGDWSYFLQLYEAARRSILEYGQFPWWNAWSLGGVPLYANPQFGLVSIQMPLVLLFGTLAGLRLSVMAYLLLGFWGMYLLLKRCGARSELIAALLSYIWLFGGFPVLHLYVGHLTFATYLLVPWFLLALLNAERPRFWIWLGLITAFLVNQAPHYVVIQMLAVGGLIALYRLMRGRARVRPLLLAMLVAVPLVAHKLYHTLTYLAEFPRPTGEDPPTPVGLLWAALTQRRPLDPASIADTPYGWHEYGAYAGIVTLALFAYAAAKELRSPRAMGAERFLLLVGIGASLVLALGAFSPLSPYALLHHLPLFDQMRVPSRWLGWAILGMILFLAALPRTKLVYLLLGVAFLDVFSANLPILNSPQPAYARPARLPQFEQFAPYPATQGEDMRLFEATQANAGEIYGYEPIVNFYLGADAARLDPLTDRCGVNQACRFVLSGNARVLRWTPHNILLERTGPGPVLLNMNPGRQWVVNGRNPFREMRLFELRKPFLILDPSRRILVEHRP